MFLNNAGNKALCWKDLYNPLDLPPNTIRVRTSNGNPPAKGSSTSYETATLVAGTNDVYDVYKSGTSMYRVLYYSTNVVEVIGANTSNITNMASMFYNCTNLTTVPLFDTSSVTNMRFMFSKCTKLTSVPLYDTSKVTDMTEMLERCTNLTTVSLFDTSNVTTMYQMFVDCTNLTAVPLFDTSSVTDMEQMLAGCSNLTAVPLFNTSKVTKMNSMFTNCYKVESGALALYQQASTQANPPTRHSYTFYNCGRDTTTGAAELAQIPADWK